jgi:hypothetical protein
MEFAAPAKTTAETAPAARGALAVPVRVTAKTGKTP